MGNAVMIAITIAVKISRGVFKAQAGCQIAAACATILSDPPQRLSRERHDE
jgi:hypothetical protein